MVAMEKVPAELLSRIFSNVDSGSRFNATLTCQKWRGLIAPTLPSLHHLHVNLDSSACNGSIMYEHSGIAGMDWIK